MKTFIENHEHMQKIGTIYRYGNIGKWRTSILFIILLVGKSVERDLKDSAKVNKDNAILTSRNVLFYHT